MNMGLSNSGLKCEMNIEYLTYDAVLNTARCVTILPDVLRLKTPTEIIQALMSYVIFLLYPRESTIPMVSICPSN